jgi:hypothetical protein
LSEKKITFKNVEFNYAEEQTIVNDFTSPLKLPKAKYDVFLDTLLLKFSLKQRAKLRIEVNNNAQLIVIEIDTANITQEVKIDKENFPISEIFAQLSRVLSIQMNPSNWSKLLIDLQTTKVESSNILSDLARSIDKNFKQAFISSSTVNLNLNADQLKMKERYDEINSRIETLEKELESNVEGGKKEKELKAEISSLESEINTLNASISSVTDLIKKRDGVVAELKKLEPLSSDSKLIQKVEKIKRRRLERLFTYLTNLSSRLGNKFSNNDLVDKTTSKESIIKFLLILVIAQLLSSIALYLYSLNNQIVYISLIGLIAQGILVTLVNIAKFQEATSIEDLSIEILENSEDIGTERENKFLINSAWINALKKELESIEKTIKVNLKDQELVQVKGEIEQKQQRIENLRKELSGLGNASLTQEDYLKKRRNLDILKIERENLQAEMPVELVNTPTLDEHVEENMTFFPLVITGLHSLESKLQTEVQMMVDTLRNKRQIIILDVE